MERLAVELIIRCTHVCEIPFTCQRVSGPRQLVLTFHRLLLLLHSPVALSATLSAVNVHKYRFHIYALTSQVQGQVLNGLIKSAAILGTLLRFVTQQSRKLPLGSGFALATGFLLGEE